MSQLAVCFSSGPDLGVRALQTERKEGSGTERYVRKGCVYIDECIFMIDPYFDYKCEIVFNKSYMLVGHVCIFMCQM